MSTIETLKKRARAEKTNTPVKKAAAPRKPRAKKAPPPVATPFRLPAALRALLLSPSRLAVSIALRAQDTLSVARGPSDPNGVTA